MTRTQLCTSVLSRISGLCNDCIRSVTDIRIVLHAGLTADGLLGVRLIIYIGVRLIIYIGESLNGDKWYMIPNVLTATLDRYIGGSLDPTRWLRDPRGMPLQQMVAQHRELRTMSQDIVLEFIRCMKRLLSGHGDLQQNCILCKMQLPVRWMIILCEGCEHTLVGGGGRDTLSLPGIEIVCFLHRIVEDIHRKRLSGNARIPAVEVDAITERMVLEVIAGIETGDNWWLREPVVNVDSPGSGGPPEGAPAPSPHGGAHSCPASTAASSSSEAIRSLAVVMWRASSDEDVGADDGCASVHDGPWILNSRTGWCCKAVVIARGGLAGEGGVLYGLGCRPMGHLADWYQLRLTDPEIEGFQPCGHTGCFCQITGFRDLS